MSASVRLRHLGQAGFQVSAAGRSILLDPYLSDWLERPGPDNPEAAVRAAQPPETPDTVEIPDLVLCTHQHPDHLDPGTVRVLGHRSDQTRFVVPAPLVGMVEALGVPRERVVGVEVDHQHDLDGVKVMAVPAAHAFHPDAFGGYTWWRDPDGRHRAVGYVVEFAGVRLFHAGDTVFWPGMDERLRGLDITLALLPINGRDWLRERRGLVGNLSAREAADLAAAAGFGLTVPMHFDALVGNTADPAEFTRYAARTYPRLRFALPDSGEGLLVDR